MSDETRQENEHYHYHCKDCSRPFLLRGQRPLEERYCECPPDVGENPLACEEAEHQTGNFEDLLDPRTVETNEE